MPWSTSIRQLYTLTRTSLWKRWRTHLKSHISFIAAITGCPLWLNYIKKKKKKKKYLHQNTKKLCRALGIYTLKRKECKESEWFSTRAKCKCYCIWLQKCAVFCTRAICWVWITAAKYIVLLTLYTAMTNWSRQGIGESTTIWLTFPHGLLEYTSSQFPSAPLFSLPAGYTALPRCYF